MTMSHYDNCHITNDRNQLMKFSENDNYFDGWTPTALLDRIQYSLLRLHARQFSNFLCMVSLVCFGSATLWYPVDHQEE
jgi:hypothetical protein